MGHAHSNEKSWTEGYVRRSMKKKLAKTLFCEVCISKIPSYLEVGRTCLQLTGST